MAQNIGQLQENAYKTPVTKMHILGWMYGKTHEDKIKSKKIRRLLGITHIEDTLGERRLT